MHWEKAQSPIIFTDDGASNITSDNESQQLKESFPIKITEDGIIKRVNDLHSLKASRSILETDDGIFISVNDEHS